MVRKDAVAKFFDRTLLICLWYSYLVFISDAEQNIVFWHFWMEIWRRCTYSYWWKLCVTTRWRQAVWSNLNSFCGQMITKSTGIVPLERFMAVLYSYGNTGAEHHRAVRLSSIYHCSISMTWRLSLWTFHWISDGTSSCTCSWPQGCYTPD